jgi:hypothetical protein
MTTVATANIEITAGGAEGVALQLLSVDQALGSIVGTGAEAASALAPVAGQVATVDAGFLAVLADAPAALAAMGEAAAASLGALEAVAGVVSSLRSAWAWLLEHPRVGLAASVSVSGGGDGDGGSGPAGQTGRQFFQGGRILVGETGPELVTLPRGSRIHPAGDTRDALGGGAGGSTPTRIEVPIHIGRGEITRVVVEGLADRGVDVYEMTGGAIRS